MKAKGSWSRKQLKASARKSMKHNYWRCMIVCVILAFMTGMFANPIKTVRNIESTVTLIVSGNMSETPGIPKNISVGSKFNEKTNTDIIGELFDNISSKYFIKNQSDTAQKYKGVLGFFANNIDASESIVYGIINSLNQMIFNGAVGSGIIILLGVFLSIFIWIFGKNIIRLGGYRFFMENHMYYSTDLRRIFFPYRVKCLRNQAKIMLLKTVYQVLWSFTIVGGFIKPYSYKMVPYITAENPKVSAKEAFEMSKRMMYGNKWRAFVIELSFIPWQIASAVTFGLVHVFYLNPYQTSTMAELYMALRRHAIDTKLQGYEIFNDTYLDPSMTDENIAAENYIVNPFDEKSEIKIYYRLKAETDGSHLSYRVLPDGMVAVGVGADYRDELFPMPVHYSSFLQGEVVREYSPLTYVLLFFTFAMIGWIWEVSLFLFTEGRFVNRGVLFGPWLPIYGVGGTAAVLILHKFVKNPMAEFIASFTMSGIIEYTTATVLWHTRHLKWWDYTGNFMNIQGRICLEGLLVFAIGCMAVLYFLAPMLDDLYKKVNLKVRVAVAVVLVCLFCGDLVYSHVHPNTGEGITTASMQTEEEFLDICGAVQKGDADILMNCGANA